MGNLILKPGDQFGSANPQFLGFAIRVVETIESEAKQAKYSHIGLITGSDGTTLESIWHIESQNLFKAYAGKEIIIARPIRLTPEMYQKGFDSIKDEIGHVYPYSRLFLDLIGLGKWIHFSNDTDCVELVYKVDIFAGLAMLAKENYWGLTPQQLVDEWRISKEFEVIFEGILP